MPRVRPKIVFWRTGMVVRGKQVYLDANFLVALAAPSHIWHSSAVALQQSFSERKTALVLSSLAFTEAIFQLQKGTNAASAKLAKPPTTEPPVTLPLAPLLSDKPEYDDDEDDYTNINDELEPKPAETPPSSPKVTLAARKNQWADTLQQTILSLPGLIYFEPPTADFYATLMRAVLEYNLDPTDAFHYAAARHLQCPLVSNDNIFQHIPDANLTLVTFYTS